MKNPYVLLGIAIVIAAAAYYFFVYKKDKGEPNDKEKSNFGGKTPCRCSQPAGKVVAFNSNGNPTYRNTGVPCNAALPGDFPVPGTIHVNGWGSKSCMRNSAAS